MRHGLSLLVVLLFCVAPPSAAQVTEISVVFPSTSIGATSGKACLTGCFDPACQGSGQVFLDSIPKSPFRAVNGRVTRVNSCDALRPVSLTSGGLVATLSAGEQIAIDFEFAPAAEGSFSSLLALGMLPPGAPESSEIVFRLSGTGALVCTATPAAPGAMNTGLQYTVSWNATSGTGGYELQEATKSDFSDAVTVSESTTSHQFQHDVTSTTVFLYRVRPVSCGGSSGSFGPPAQTVVLAEQPDTSRDFDLVAGFGGGGVLSQRIRFTGLTAGAPFTATTDKTYLTVTPASGTVAADGTVSVTVRANSANLAVGTNTGTLFISVSSGKGSAVPNDSRSSSTTVSVSLVTPVTATAKGAPPSDALIIPAVAHLEGVVPFRSDIRITNAAPAAATYLLSFTPSNIDGTTSGRQTSFTVAPDQTVAFNDVLKNFFGFALPSDAAGGVLELRAVNGTMANTFVSSRTYAATANGTYGQFIPAVPLAKFLKAGGSPLILTQVAQSPAFRTNIGLAEGLGSSITGRLRVFDPAGQSLGEFPFTLRAFEFQQLGSFLAGKGITATNARIDVVGDSGSGSVTTYASVLDNKTQDPLLVSPIQQGTSSANRYVLPGIADFTSPVSNFHSDVRIYNGSSAAVSATATFYPQGNGTPVAKNIDIAASEIKAYDNVLPGLFGVTGTGGAIVVTTAANVPLIVSGRTYSNDAASGGTFGQFIPAVTPAEGVGVSDPPLQVLQLEQSANFRSNLGLSELTGNPVTVQVSAIFPDAKSSPSTTVDLQGNEFRQLGSILASLNAGNTYNARITVKVTAGSGRVTAYGSVIDFLTSDPTYVPAQK